MMKTWIPEADKGRGKKIGFPRLDDLSRQGRKGREFGGEQEKCKERPGKRKWWLKESRWSWGPAREQGRTGGNTRKK